MEIEIILYILAAICAYLITSINPAIVMSRLIYHKDIRKCGSGNPGFTNFKRTFGSRWAWWVFILDLVKGAAVTALFAWSFSAHGMGFQLGAAYTGIFALLGHAYPIWHGFKGGKGFLVYLSVSLVIDWRAGLIAFGVMVLLLLLTKYMSVSTVLGLFTCPITLAIFNASLPVILMCLACVIYIAIRHRENFKRLLKGTENKFTLKMRKPKKRKQAQ